MATVTESRPRVKPSRTIRLALAPSDVNPASVVTISVGSQHDDYMVLPMPADFGAAYGVTKIGDPDQKFYHVNLAGNGSTCECKGHLKWGHCKHVEGLTALRNAGKL